jgi:hypothetical protein
VVPFENFIVHRGKNGDNKNIDFTMSFSLNLRITNVVTNL